MRLEPIFRIGCESWRLPPQMRRLCPREYRRVPAEHSGAPVVARPQWSALGSRPRPRLQVQLLYSAIVQQHLEVKP